MGSVQVVEERLRRPGVVASPEIDDIGPRVTGQPGHRVLEDTALFCYQLRRVARPPFVQPQLQQELDPKFADVSNRPVEPAVHSASPPPRRSMQGSVRPGISGFGVVVLDELGGDETVECPVHQRSMNGHDPAEICPGPQFFRDGKPVCWALGQEPEHHPFCWRQFDSSVGGLVRLVHRQSRDCMASSDATI